MKNLFLKDLYHQVQLKKTYLKETKTIFLIFLEAKMITNHKNLISL